MNIYQRVNEIRKEVSGVQKQMVQAGRYSYKAMMSDDVIAAIRESMIKHGVVTHPVDLKQQHGVLKTRNGESQKVDVLLTVRWVNVDDPKDYFDVPSLGTGVDTQDKAPGKAITYADKYSFLKTLNLMGGEDPDQTASPRTTAQASDSTVVTDDGIRQTLIPLIKQHRADLVAIQDEKYKIEIMQMLIKEVRKTDMSSAAILDVVKKFDDIPFG